MDYDRASQSITTLLKSAVPEGGTTKDYDRIPVVDEQRDIIVSHLKSTYTTETGEMLNAKEFIDTSKTYKNMLKVSEGEMETIQSKTKTLESEIVKEKDHIKKSKNVNNILKILFVTVLIAIVIYVVLGSWAHILAIIILLLGLGIALYTRGEIPSIDFSSIKQWIYTTLGL
jgi:hypothetical protein